MQEKQGKWSDNVDRAAAFEKAKAARRARAEAKEAVATGALKPSDVVAKAKSGDEALARMRVADLVSSVPGVGAAHTGRILTELGIAEGRRLKGLGLRQAPALCERLDRVQAAHKPAKPRRA